MFKVGDKVKRISHHNNYLSPTMVYTVKDVRLQDSEIALDAVPGWWESIRFSLADQLEKESDPSGISLHSPGAKADAGKLRPTLVLRDMANALEAVIKIATDGAVKYSPGGWLTVPNAEERYEDADLRHMLKRFMGEPVDKDSESLHLAHQAWNALAKLELHLRSIKNDS